MNSSRTVEERLALVLGVVLLGQPALDRAQLQRDDVSPLRSIRDEDLADQLALDTVGLDQDQGAFDIGTKTWGGSSLCSGGRGGRADDGTT